MKREDFKYVVACFQLTPRERTVVLAAAAVLALGSAVKYWRESRPLTEALPRTAAGKPLKPELKK